MNLLSGNIFLVNLVCQNVCGYRSQRYGEFIIDEISVICPLFRVVESRSFIS